MLHQLIIIAVYIFICYIIALLGKNRKFGFWGFLFLSLSLTPLVGFIAFLASSTPDKK